jgi:hypothetical protein
VGDDGPPAYAAGDLPEKPRGFFKLVGPGAVLVGLAIGAGELIVWPIMTARFGATIVWAALVGIAFQVVINVEVGRYTLATGESVYAGFARLSRAWVPIFLLLNVLGWLLPGWARTCAGALKAISVGSDGPGDSWAWTALTFAIVALVLFGPRHVYRTIERITIGLVMIMLVGLTAIAVRIGSLDALAELARGAASIGTKPADLPTYELFSAIVFAGAGGTTNLMLSYYLLNKGWGMGAAMPEGEEGSVAFRVRDSPANRARWREWLAHVRNDQIIFFGIMNSITILLFVFAALVILHADGIVPAQEMLVLQEAALLERIWGKPGAYLFLLVGIACLFSTQLTLVDGVARSCADLVHTNYATARRLTFTFWYRAIALAWMIAGTALTWVWGRLPPFLFLLSAGFFGGIAMAAYCPLLLAANTRLLPEDCRPRRFGRLALSGVSVFYIVFAVAAAWVVASELLAG